MAKKKATKKATKKVAKKATKKAAKKTTKKAAAKKATKKAAPKKATKKVAAPKKTTKKAAAKPKTKRKPNPAFMKALTPSNALAAIVGTSPIPRTEVIKKVWAYIKRNNLQNPNNKRNILADDKLAPIFGKKEVSMFEMTKLVSGHLK